MRKVKTFVFFDIVRDDKDLISMPVDQKRLYGIQKLLSDIHVIANQNSS